MGDYEIREFRDGDERSLLETFNLTFATGEDALPARTMAQWEWSYRENPSGKRIFVAVHDGKIVAQYAGMPNRVRFEGREYFFLDIIDSMVHPDHRTGLKKPGLFIKTAQPFLETYGSPDRDLAFYGWPIEKAWPINKRFLGYEQIRSESVLARPPDGGPVEVPAEVEVVERFEAGVGALYERCSANWGLSFVRDEAFMNWRYLTNPFHTYTCYAVGVGSELRGFAVYRAPGADMPETALLVDLLVAPDDVETGRLLEQAVLARARADGAGAIATIQLEWTPWFARFQEWGWLVWPSEWIMVASLFHPRLDPIWLRDNWWYQMGDLDVV